MQLGAFSISLAVKDITASKTFYETLGFVQFGGNIEQGWIMLRNGEHVIGLFQGMFEKNMLTFNPGWDQHANTLETFDDVRVLQQRVQDAGIAIEQQADTDSSGPASFVIVDPDGNPVLVDQHI
ncbi:MAG: VOC family protein [Pseudomonadota bacterium]